MVSSLWASRLLSLSKSLSFSLNDSCSWWISLSFSSMAANFSSKACCRGQTQECQESNRSQLGNQIIKKEYSPPEHSPFLLTFVAVWQACCRYCQDFCFAQSPWPYLCTPDEHRKMMLKCYLKEYNAKFYFGYSICFFGQESVCVYYVTCSCCSLSASMDVSRWIVTSWVCSFLLVWSSSSWYCCSRALSLSRVSPFSFFSWLFRSWSRTWCR